MTSEPLDLDAIEQRANAATEGPWIAEIHHHRRTGAPVEFEVHPVAEKEGNGDGGVTSAADAEFIAHAREDVPALVDEVRRSREQRDAARGEVMAELLNARRRAKQAEAKVARVEALAAEWERLGRGDGIHGRQLRRAIDEEAPDA